MDSVHIPISHERPVQQIMMIVARIISFALKIIIAGLIGTAFILPLLWVVFTAFNATPTYTLSVPKQWSLGNITLLSQSDTAFPSLWNSIVLSVGTAILCIALGSLAAYALSRINIPGSDLICYLILLISSVGTGTAAMVPLFQLMTDMKLIDHQFGVILVLTAIALPSTIFVLKDRLDSVPKSYEESARLMGAGPLRILCQIVAPIIRSSIAFTAIWALKNTWSDFLIPYLLLRDADKQPAAVTMYTFYTEGGQANIGMLCAFALVFSIPAIALYIIINRVWGFAFSSGLKG